MDVWGQTQEEHDVRLHAVLEKAQKAGHKRPALRSTWTNVSSHATQSDSWVM